MKKLENKIALITGSTSGIGAAIARKFSEQGATVIVCGRSAEAGNAVADTLQRDGGKATCFAADIADEGQVKDLVDAVISRFGQIDILVNNAGPNGNNIAIGPIHDLPTEQFDANIRIGVYGLFWVNKYVLPHMMKNGGSIIHTSSLTAVRALPKFSAYAVSKAAMEAISRQIANDYSEFGIRSNTLLVGTVRPTSDETSALPENLDLGSLDDVIRGTTMMGRLGSYTDVAEAALFFASDESRYITGATLPVDGGASAKLQYPDYTRHGL